MGSIDLKTFKDLRDDVTQYFWFESNSSASYGAGVHITLSPESTFKTSPSGQNILINTDGISIRNGLLPMMVLDNDSLDFNVVDTVNGTYTNVASFGAVTTIGVINDSQPYVQIDSTGMNIYNGLNNVATFGQETRIGNNNDASGAIIIKPTSFTITSQEQVVALDVETSNIERDATTICLPSTYISPSTSAIVNGTSQYDLVPNGKELEYTIKNVRTITSYSTTSWTWERIERFESSYKFTFYKGTSKSVTTYLDFFYNGSTSSSDVVSLPVSIVYNGTSITITSPNYMEDNGGDVISTPNYQNSLSTEFGVLTQIVHIPSIDANGMFNLTGDFNFDMPLHLEASSVDGGTTVSNVKTGNISNYSGGTNPTINITCSGFALTNNAVVYFPTMYIEEGVESVLLNINATGAKTLYYNGAPLSYLNGGWVGPQGMDSNFQWIYQEIVGVYYDGTNYQQFVTFDRKDALGKLMLKIIDLDLYDYVIITNENIS